METAADAASPRIFEYADHWLVRRSDTPNYHIYWCRPGTRRVRRKSTDTGDLEQAKRRLIEFAHQRRRPANGDPAGVSIHEVLVEYVERNMADKPSLHVAKTAMGRFDAFFEIEHVTMVADVTLDLQDRFIEWRRQQLIDAGHTGSNGTISRELDVLRAALRAFWKRGHLKTVPFVRGLPQPRPRQRFLTESECRRLIDACEEKHLWLFVMLALHTLQRPAAIFGLRTEQVLFDQNRIDFLPEGAIQSNKRRPVVPITRTIRPILEEAVAASQSRHVVEYFGAPVKAVRRSFAKACKRAGLKDVTPYTLRHTGATLAAAKGVPMRQIAGMLGHSEVRTTERYAKHAPEFLKQAADALDDLFGPAAARQPERNTDSSTAQVVDFPRRIGMEGVHDSRAGARQISAEGNFD